MCIAVLNKANITLSRETINNCWRRNKDGGGILYATQGKLMVFKTKNKKKFKKFYERLRKEMPHEDIVLHFRYSTHGKEVMDNVHPHIISEHIGFVHNGVIRNVVDDNTKSVKSMEKGVVKYVKEYDSDKSDSALFADMLKELPKDFITNEALMELIEDYIGTGNKIIFLDKTGKYAIANEEKGVWDSGCWFSNDAYLSEKEKKKKEPKPMLVWDDYEDPYSINAAMREAIEDDKEFDDDDDEEGCCYNLQDRVGDNLEYMECEYCMGRCYGQMERARKTCNACFNFFNDGGVYD